MIRLAAFALAAATTLPGGYDPTVWEDHVADFFPADQVETALCVIGWESGGNPHLVNDTETHAGGSVGLFQIAADNWAGRYRIAGLERWPTVTLTQARRLLRDYPTINIAAAAAIWRANGWLPAWRAQKHRCGLR